MSAMPTLLPRPCVDARRFVRTEEGARMLAFGRLIS